MNVLCGFFGALALVTLVSAASRPEADPNVRQNFLELLDQIVNFVESKEYAVLGKATNYVLNPYPYSTNRKPYISAQEAIADKIKNTDQAKLIKGIRQRNKFESAFKTYIEQPCKTVLSLNQKYLNYFKLYSTDEVKRWEMSARRPVTLQWQRSVEVCQRGSLENSYNEFKKLRRSK